MRERETTAHIGLRREARPQRSRVVGAKEIRIKSGNGVEDEFTVSEIMDKGFTSVQQ